MAATLAKLGKSDRVRGEAFDGSARAMVGRGMPQQRVPADVIPVPSRRPVVVSVLAAAIAAAWTAEVVDAALDLSRFVRGGRVKRRRASAYCAGGRRA